MSYLLIKGEYHIFYPDTPRNGPEPDGDTLRFRPDNLQLINSIPSGGTAPKFNKRHMTSLRLEGIDALETHFGDMHQHLAWANAARDALLAACGFGAVTFWPDAPNKVQSVWNHPVRGHIAVNGVDSHGRLVCFAFAGDTPEADGTALWLEAGRMLTSLNAELLGKGLAYPAFYTSLPATLREPLRELVLASRTQTGNLWADAIPIGTDVTVNDRDSLETLVMWPKLFRRLVDYFAAGYSNLDQLDSWLRQDVINRDDRMILPNREIGNMHDVVIGSRNSLRMVYQPEDLIILPDPQVNPTPAPHPPSVARDALRIIAALPNPEGHDTGKESVTLLNTSATTLALEGWQLSNGDKHQTLEGNMEAGATLRIPLASPLTLTNTGGNILLRTPEGIVVHQVTYTASQTRKAGWTLAF